MAEMTKYGENMTTENNLCELSDGGLAAFSKASLDFSQLSHRLIKWRLC